MATYAELLTEIRDIIGEPTAAQWTDPMLRRWINEGGRDLARVTRHVKRFTETAIVSNTPTINLDDDIIAVEVATWFYDNATISNELIPVHVEEWSTATNGLVYQQGHPTHFTVMGSQPDAVLWFFPIPDGDSWLRMHCAVLPTQIADDGTDDANTIDFPLAWYDALGDYCEFKALRRDRDPRWQEAYQAYTEKRDALTVSPDYLAISRNLIPDPMSQGSGYVPAWLAAFD